MVQKTIDYNRVIYLIDNELKRINWSQEKAQNYIQFYYGVKSRMHLKDNELFEFLEFLKAYNPRFNLRIRPLKFKRYGVF